MSKFRAWLELSRGANLPTVWSNVLIGWLITASFGAPMDASTPVALGALLLGASLLYTGGMFLNDACDVEWDKVHRPERPIPSGRLSPGAVRLAAAGCLAAGSTLILWAARPAAFRETGVLLGLLLAAILAYSRWHKGNPLAPLLMGLCRALLPLLGFLALETVCSPSGQCPVRLALTHASAVGLYTVSISLLARHEATGGRPPVVATWLAALAPFITLLGWPPGEIDAWTWGVAALTGLSIPLYQRLIPDIAERVAERIAGLIMLDYVAWRLIAPGFVETDRLAHGGVALVVLYGTALGLRRLMPST